MVFIPSKQPLKQFHAFVPPKPVSVLSAHIASVLSVSLIAFVENRLLIWQRMFSFAYIIVGFSDCLHTNST